MNSVAPADAERLYESMIWAGQRYAIHFERCRARLEWRECQMCEDLDCDLFDAADAYERAIRP